MMVMAAILVTLALGGVAYAFAGGDSASRKRVQPLVRIVDR